MTTTLAGAQELTLADGTFDGQSFVVSLSSTPDGARTSLKKQTGTDITMYQNTSGVTRTNINFSLIWFDDRWLNLS